MELKDKIYVAGHKGLVGSALVRSLKSQGYEHLIVKTHKELDLTQQKQVEDFFAHYQPDYVFLAAAKVGGIWANQSQPVDFIKSNLEIQNNIISNAYRYKVKRLIFLGSSCIYPRDCPQPIREDYLLSGYLELTNRPYALAKIAGIEMCWAYNRQFDTRYLAVMPTNLYGPDDNYDLNTSHVIPGLMRKMHEAKINHHKQVMVWGSGQPYREFLYSDDLASACLHLMNLSNEKFVSFLSSESPPLINIGYGEELTISQLANKVAEVVGFKGEIIFDKTKPDGTPRKILSSEKIQQVGWRPSTNLIQGLQQAYTCFQQSVNAKVVA